MDTSTAAWRWRLVACLLVLISAGLLGGCAYQTLDGTPPQVNADDRLGPFN